MKKPFLIIAILLQISCQTRDTVSTAKPVVKKSPTVRPVQRVQGECLISKTKEGYERANVGQDVLAAIKRGELRYVALSGYGAYVPGIEEFAGHEVTDDEVCYIGNVDFCVQVAEPIGIAAAAYAACYNRHLKQELSRYETAAQQVTAPDTSSGPR